MNKEQLIKVLADRSLWLTGESKGQKANLQGTGLLHFFKTKEEVE